MAEARAVADRLVKERQPLQLLVCWNILEHSQQDNKYAQEAGAERLALENAYEAAA